MVFDIKEFIAHDFFGMKTKQEYIMTRRNIGFEGGNQVTQEEIDKMHENGDPWESTKLVDRMWQEVQDLRSVLKKQIYQGDESESKTSLLHGEGGGAVPSLPTNQEI